MRVSLTTLIFAAGLGLSAPATLLAEHHETDAAPAAVASDAAATVAEGREVGIRYTVILDNGSIADTNEDGEPLTFTQGSGQILPALEAAIAGLSVGDRKEVKLAAKDAYGEIREDMLKEIPIDRIPEASREVDAVLQATRFDGQKQPVRVAEVREEIIILDFNHPLAGEDLTFDIEVLSID